MKDNFAILAYHRVIPIHKTRSGVQAGMYVTPKTFEYHIQFLKNCLCIVPMSELPLRLGRMGGSSKVKPICALTFDDGWYDFYTYVYPILLKHEVPVKVFLPTDFVGSKDWFWTDRLAFLLQQYNPKNAEKGSRFSKKS